MPWPAPSSARILVTTMIVVVATFAGSLWLSNVRLARIDADVWMVNEQTTPALEHLDAARGALMWLGFAVPDYLYGPPEHRPASRVQIEAERATLQDALKAYEAIPYLPGEARIADSMKEDLQVMDRAATAVLQSDTPEAFQTFGERWIAVSRTLDSLIQLNTDDVRSRAAEIEDVRDRAADLALALGIVSLAAAVAATALAVRTLRAQAALEAAARTLLESRAAELDLFAGRVAHDLRDPLSAMALRLTVAQRIPLGPSGLEDLTASLNRQITSMNRTIDALLAFARSAGRPEADARADLPEVVRALLVELEPLAQAAEARLELGELPPVAVRCAPGAVRSVLVNLVANALKHVGRGSDPRRLVTVSAEIRGQTVRVAVADTGPGLPPGTEQRVFEPFVRLEEAPDRGIGLGLATVKRIVEAHGGAVGVESRPGSGATFWFELPVR